MSIRPESQECCTKMAYNIECHLIYKMVISPPTLKSEYYFEKEVLDDDDDYNNISERLTYCPFCGRQL